MKAREAGATEWAPASRPTSTGKEGPRMTTVKLKTKAGAGIKPLVIEMPVMEPKRASVRFNPVGGRNRKSGAAVHALYIERHGWEQLGKPAGVRITIDPLS